MTLHKIYELFLSSTGITTDTRNCPKGSIYIALKGANFDGNNFLQLALDSGSSYAITDNKEKANNENIIYVEDGLKCLQDLAALHRSNFKNPVIGITGTNGKTTTKELIAAVLQTQYNVLFTKGNLNNHIGVPLTLLQLKPEHEIAVIEMGANHPKEIEFLCNIAEPDFGIITNVGKAHLEGFGSFENIIKTKCELYENIRKKNGTIFLHTDNEVLSSEAVNLNLIKYGSDSSNFVSGHLNSNGEFLQATVNIETKNNQINTQLVGDYNLSNLLAAICIGKYFKVSEKNIITASQDYTPSNNRSQKTITENNTLIVDAYNANPTSMQAAIENFAKMQIESRTLILGDMGELGADSEQEHQNIITLIQKLGFNNVYLVGKNFSQIECSYKKFNNVDELKADLQVNPLKANTILIKGSNSTRLSTLVESL